MSVRTGPDQQPRSPSPPRDAPTASLWEREVSPRLSELAEPRPRLKVERPPRSPSPPKPRPPREPGQWAPSPPLPPVMRRPLVSRPLQSRTIEHLSLFAEWEEEKKKK